MIFSIFIYLFSIFLTLISLYLMDNSRKITKAIKKYNIINFFKVFVCFIPLIILFSFREGVGTDYYTYQYLFENLAVKPKSFKLIFTHYIESGWVILSYLSLFFSKSFLFFKVLVSSLFFAYVTLIIKDKELKYKILFTFLMFAIMFFPFMNITRQILACIILIYSLIKLFENKFILFFLNVILASLFHKSALFFFIVLVIYYIYNKKNIIIIKRKKITLFQLLEALILISPLYLLPVLKLISDLLLKYNISSYYIYDSFNLNIKFILYTLPIIIMSKYFLMFVKKQNLNDLKTLYFLTLINYLFQVLGCLFLLFERLSVYFFDLYVLLFPIIYSSLNNKKRKLFLCILYGYFVIYFIFMFVILNGQGCFPYEFIK